MQSHMLVVGGSGVTGSGAVSELHNAGWKVTTLSRSVKSPHETAHLSADLLDISSLQQHTDSLASVTHLFYAAIKPSNDAQVEAEENSLMFKNIIESVIAAGADLKRVIFLQGGKVYGAHLGVYKTPARENDSRHFPPNLYFEHEDYARTLPERGIQWTALRPDIMIGHSLGSDMNMGNLIGLYGTLCKHFGVAMQFPGSAAAFNVLINFTSASTLGKAVVWAAENDKDGAYNITNGDVCRWQHIWPKVAQWFGLEPGEPQPINLQQRLNQYCSDTWRELAKMYNLQESDINRIAQGGFGDFLFHVETDGIFDVTKARQSGFNNMTLYSDEQMIQHLDNMVARGLIPDPKAMR
ncbi:NAD-dependent epimerase/dehydratase family protein [Vibrio palustris]|uniref:NAD dependent epimerase/dehydratase family protein n=1 Tax=Vibrio palustris TaxID=1918946 RepID=A0A1R4B0U7_9VIBR|nr:NAD-dependent epimerase/dehydratase family protein [Vibrio palustris]SJL82545.1 NAD dependent epimerase/dehydratase family protein [Vibrio palustris]